MTKRRRTKLGLTVLILHILFAVFILCAIITLLTPPVTIQPMTIDTRMHTEQQLFMSIRGLDAQNILIAAWALSIPITIFDILYAAKHLMPGDRLRVPIIISAAFFGLLTICFCIAPVASRFM